MIYILTVTWFVKDFSFFLFFWRHRVDYKPRIKILWTFNALKKKKNIYPPRNNVSPTFCRFALEDKMIKKKKRKICFPHSIEIFIYLNGRFACVAGIVGNVSRTDLSTMSYVDLYDFTGYSWRKIQKLC